MVTMSPSSTCSNILSQSQQERLIQKLEIFKIQGRDKHGHPLLCIFGNLFPGKLVEGEALKKYLEKKIFPKLGDEYSVVYFHAGFQRSKNFPGISTLRTISEAIPLKIRNNLKAIYFLHPDFQSRIFLGVFGGLLFPKGVYKKMRYVERLGLLWNVVKRKEMGLPEFISNYDDNLDYRRTMEFSLESDHPRPRVDCDISSISTFSTRCIA